MAVITHKKRCPSCGNTDLTRKHRSLWMRWFKRSRLYQCRRCRAKIVLLNEHVEPPTEEYLDDEFGDKSDRG